MGNAPRDDNNVPTLIGVSSADGITPVTIYVDPTTHRVLTSATASVGGNDTEVQFNDAGSLAGDAGFVYNKTSNIATLGGLLISGLTASEIVATDASKNLQSLAVATYPSLTELTYVKGVTSAIQTQLDAKLGIAGTNDITNGAIYRTGTTTSGHSYKFEGYDNDAAQYRDMIKIENANEPVLTLSEAGANILIGQSSLCAAAERSYSGFGATLNPLYIGDGNYQNLTLTEDATVTFAQPAGPTLINLRVIQDATGGWDVTWASSPTWVHGEPNWSAMAANEVKIISVYWDGSGYTVTSIGSSILDTSSTVSALTTVGTLVAGNATAIVDAGSKTAAGKLELATTAEIDAGTDTARAMPIDQFVASKRNIRWLIFPLVEAGTDCAVASNIYGDFVSPIAGTILQSDTTPFYLYATNSTAGTTGTMVVDISIGGTSIMTTNKLDFDTTEKTTTTAATPPDLTTTALAVGDIITIDIDSIHTTAAKGLTVYMAVRE